MYHEITYKSIRDRRRNIVFYGFLIALVVVEAVFAAGFWRNAAREQAVESVRDAIVGAAVQCCAVEGSYPASLSHLEQDYGLVVNSSDYVVTYEWLGDNVPPSVTVRPR